jgi:hypothetical protein
MFEHTVSSLERVVIYKVDDGNRLATSCSDKETTCNKLLRACCHQLVNTFLCADDTRLVETTSL